jgi:penicillin amidase
MRWCDNVRSPRVETCAEQISDALHTAMVALTRDLGGDMPRWRWDALHRAVFPHLGLDTVRALRPILNRSVPNGGDFSTINVGPVDAERPFEQRSVSGYRQIIDLSPANDSRYSAALGQSGHFLSLHYDDNLEDWRMVQHKRMLMDRAAIERDAVATLKLLPR